MAGVSLVAKDKNFTKVVGYRPLTLEQRVKELFIDPRANRGAMWIIVAGVAGTMFQDVACTIPVTAVDQPVRVLLDSSGNGCHWVAPTDAARPLYRLDGVIPYLYADGMTAEMNLTTPGKGITSFSNYTICSMGFLADEISTFRTLFRFNTESNNNRISLGTDTSPSSLRGILRRNYLDAALNLDLPRPSGKHLWTLDIRYKVGTAFLLRDITVASVTGSLATTGISENGTSIGTYLFGVAGTALAKSRFYGGIILASENDITSAKADIELYLAGKMAI